MTTHQQIPAVYHHRIGDIAVTALSDGTLERSLDLLRSITVEESEKLFRDAFRPGVVISVNAFVLRIGDRHWNDDAAMARGTERQKKFFFQQAREQMAPYRDRMRTFRQGEVLPGVTAIPCHGHTPGHTAYLVESGGRQLLVWGDMVHIPEVQIPRPEVTIDFDTDPQAAAASRRRIFDMAASERLLVTGMHLHFPGFGHLTRRGDGFAFTPQAWQQVL